MHALGPFLDMYYCNVYDDSFGLLSRQTAPANSIAMIEMNIVTHQIEHRKIQSLDQRTAPPGLVC